MAPPSRAFAARFGVTRLARVTGLDRCGVEVVAAVRPAGHVLQVSQGKGHTLEAAQWSALGEAIELAAAEAPDPSRLRFSVAPADALFDVGGLAVAWIDGRRLADGRRCSVPAECVYCPPAGTAWLGPSVTGWSSNGLGAHAERRRAEEHAVLELLERDALARVLPRGWTTRAARARLVEAPAWAARLAGRGLACFTFDLSLPEGPPVAGALLFDLESDVVPLTAGYACRRSWDAAVDAAVLEAAQSRLTEIHGAREDVLTGRRERGAELLAALQRATPRPPPRRSDRRPLRALARGSIALVTLAEAPFVVKAVSPDLLVSELL
ncbi:MAG: YcaO-like family protein [Myxococcota bacterium]